MKGIIFTEFMDLVDEAFGLETVDAILQDTELESGGSYTSLGTYDHKEILALVGALSKKTGVPVPDLVKTFGGHLIKTFTTKFAEFFEAEPDTLAFLTKIEGHIHMEVRKLYDNTELPTFECEYESERILWVIYRSHRPFADLAHGMIEATGKYYGNDLKITREDLSSDSQYCVKFRVERLD